MKPDYARVSQIVSLFAVLFASLLWMPSARAADYSELISEIDQKIAELEAQKSRALRELRKGLYCSECKRTASEIERAERVSFEQHLKNVKGDAIPASNEVINRKAREYDQRIEALQRQRQQLLNQQRQDSERQEQARRNQIEAERHAAEAALRRQQQQQEQEENLERARQFEAATVKQFQRQQQAEGIADALMQGFNRATEQNRKWEDFQEARRERERQWEREEREIDLLRQQEAAQAAEAAARNSQPAPVNPPPYTPPPAAPVSEPEPEPYRAPSLGGFLSDDAKQFGAEVVVESATILGGELWGQATEGNQLNLRNAAASGINNLAGNTFNSIVDDTVDSVKDTAYNTFMSLLPQDRQMDIRALQMPLSFLSLRWDNVKDAYFGPHSTWQKDFVDPFNQISSYLWKD